MSTFSQFVGDPEELPLNLPSKLDALRYICLKTSPALSGPALLSAVADDILEKYELNNDKPFLIRYDFFFANQFAWVNLLGCHFPGDRFARGSVCLGIILLLISDFMKAWFLVVLFACKFALIHRFQKLLGAWSCYTPPQLVTQYHSSQSCYSSVTPCPV